MTLPGITVLTNEGSFVTHSISHGKLVSEYLPHSLTHVCQTLGFDSFNRKGAEPQTLFVNLLLMTLPGIEPGFTD